jgi:hypothetical protein
MMDFEVFKEKWIDHCVNVVEVKQPNGYPMCPFSKHARTNNQIQFIDGSQDLFYAIEQYTCDKEIGVIWLGNLITDDHREIVRQISKENPHIIYFLTDRILSNVIITHDYENFVDKRTQLLLTGNYYNAREIYPATKIKSQMIGTADMPKAFDRYCGASGSVLDIGGNAGNLLRNREIDKYTSLDVSVKSIQYGRMWFPDSNFYYHNKFNWFYNITGNRDEPFPDIELHDYIFINSVFTSCDYNEMLETLQWCIKRFNKKIVFNIWNIKNTELLDAFEKRHDLLPMLLADVKMLYLFKNDNTFIDARDQDYFDIDEQKCNMFASFYDIVYIKERLETSLGVSITSYNPCEIDKNFTTFTIGEAL